MHIAILVPLALLSQVSVLHAQSHASPESLRQQIRAGISNSVTRADQLTIVLRTVALAKGSSGDHLPHILEFKTTLTHTDDRTEVYSTVHTAQIRADKQATSLATHRYSELLSDVPLTTVKRIDVEVVARPVPASGSVKFFDNISGLFRGATRGNPAIETVRRFLPSPDQSVEVPFRATFLVPANYHEYDRLLEEGARPVLEPRTEVAIPWIAGKAKLGKHLPRLLVRFVFGDEYFTNRKEIAGFVEILPSKVPVSSIDEGILRDLKSVLLDLATADRRDLRDQMKPVLERVEALSKALYRERDFNLKTYFSVVMVTQMANLYGDYLWKRKDSTAILTAFRDWVGNARQSAASNNLIVLHASNVYERQGDEEDNEIRIVPVYLPTGYTNHELEWLFNMQVNLHGALNDFPKDEREKWINDVSLKIDATKTTQATTLSPEHK